MENFRNLLLGAGLAVAALTSCAGGGQSAVETVSGLNPANFDTTLNGKKTELITIKNSNGMEVCLTNYGGRVVSICVPDKDGKPTDVVLGYDNSQHAADRFGLRDAGNIYGRLTNSTQGVFEDRVAALEGGVAGLAVASGAAAVTYALQNILQNGDHVVAADNLYGGSFNT